MKRIVALVVLVVLAGGAWMFRGPIALKLSDRAVATNMQADAVAGLPDGLHAFVCGSGSPLPDRTRAGPCLTVIAGQRVFLVDAGEGAAEVLSGGGIPAGRIDRLFLTHFHSDHIDGLSAVALQRWIGSAATKPLLLVGPPGVERLAAGFSEAYAIDNTYRTGHHGAAVAPPSGGGFAAQAFAMPAGQDSVVVLNEGGLKVTAFRVDHGPVDPAVGYRFEYKGRSLVVSGDTSANPGLVANARGADLLVHDALSPVLVRRLKAAATKAGQTNRAKILEDIINYHASPEDVAREAKEAGVKAVLLTHLVPPLPLPGLDVPFVGNARKLYDGPLWLARDRDLISLPAGSTKIERKRLGR
ncbi:MBL fold metallo-hydrolase [Caulobacter sp. NIBR1757]|uniref:MBL fold metallo-hydrolase n=1 Tax=Caulobacter sp. NIBR1757 TaxID=3016000 RepID=UPI0022F0F354|nr:MBL fold metallo-hydrolase [Caulobacter sp. NIBR1757]WGM38528.1 Ribonuclease BN [Caulobacter sp. NIBR1757]